MDKYPHESLLEKSGLKITDLSNDLQTVIRDFADRKRVAKKPETVAKLTASSVIIAQNIVDYYLGEDSQVEIPADPTAIDISSAATEIKEEIALEKQNPEPPASTPDPAPTPTSDPTPEPKPAVEPKQEPAPEEQEPEPPKPDPTPAYTPKSSNEKALHDLYSKGITNNINRDMLKGHGFDTGFFGPLTTYGCTVGKYKLIRQQNGTLYDLKTK
jgi:hypothetical protein